MRMPGFTAHASLYKSETNYQMAAGDGAPAVQVVPAAASCSSCFAYRTGPFTFRGNRLCCTRVCLPFAGCRESCWVESCNPFADAGVLV